MRLIALPWQNITHDLGRTIVRLQPNKDIVGYIFKIISSDHFSANYINGKISKQIIDLSEAMNYIDAELIKQGYTLLEQNDPRLLML